MGKHSTSKPHYIKPHIEEWESVHNSCKQYEVNLIRLCIGHTMLTYGHLMSRKDHQSTCTNTAYETTQ